MPPETATQILYQARRQGSGSALREEHDEREDDRARGDADYVWILSDLGSQGAWPGTVNLDALLMAAVGLDRNVPMPATQLLLPTSLRGAKQHLHSSRSTLSRDGPSAGHLIHSLSASLEDEPVESGFSHPGEDILRGAFSSHAEKTSKALAHWFGDLCDADKAQALLLFGRTSHPEAAGLVRLLARPCLQSSDLELREAAIHALEAVGGSGSRAILREHRESDPVLRDYVARVVRDLAG